MKIGQSYNLFTFITVLFLAVTGIVVVRTFNVQKNIERSEQHRYRSFLLAMELFQSSEDLTRMARSYVTTGKPIYEKHYFEILDIRNGKKPRPAHYNVTYWNLVLTEKDPGTVEGETIALEDLMRREGFAKPEFDLLRASQAKSDHLVIMEEKAFAALKGLFDDGHGNLTVPRTPDRDYAAQLLFSEEYFAKKALIMAPIKQFIDNVDKRTDSELIAFQSRLRQQIFLSLVLISITLLIIFMKIIHTHRMILIPVKRLRNQVNEIATGNYSARCVNDASNEIGDLCLKFNDMASSLQTDILMRQQAEDALRESEEQVRLLLNSTAEAIYGLDLDGNCTFANPSCLRILGYTDIQQILGRNMHSLIHHSYPDGTRMPIEACKIYQASRQSKGAHVDDEVLWKSDGTSFHAEYFSHPQVSNGEVRGEVVTFFDITKRRSTEEALKESENKYRELSITDSLTQLYNSRQFYEQLQMETARANRYNLPITLILLDVDNFKSFNDTHGHIEGDQVLMRLGQVIKRCLRKTDFAYRYGGEEFTILLPMTTSINAGVIAERIRTEFKKELFMPTSGKALQVTMSIGFAQYQPNEGMKLFVQRVDQFMYQAKNSGKDRICSDSMPHKETHV